MKSRNNHAIITQIIDRKCIKLIDVIGEIIPDKKLGNRVVYYKKNKSDGFDNEILKEPLDKEIKWKDE